MSRSRASSSQLLARLDGLYHSYNREESATDPVHLVRPFSSTEDREIAGFCAAALAFGRVASVINSITTLFGIMGPHPAAFVRGFEPDAPHRALRAMVHRWTRGVDLVALLWILRQMLDRHGSIEQFFVEGLADEHEDVGPALDSFSTRALALDLRRAYGRRPPAPNGIEGKRPGVCYFFPRPSAGSACKRLNLYLRWMVRSDEVGESSILIRNELGGTTQAQMANIRTYEVIDDTLVLLFGKAAFLMLPLEALEEGERQALLERVRRRGM